MNYNNMHVVIEIEHENGDENKIGLTCRMRMKIE